MNAPVVHESMFGNPRRAREWRCRLAALPATR